MKRTLILFVCLLISNFIFAQSPVWQWAQVANGSFNETGFSTAIDNLGNVYVTGSFESPDITFNGTTLINASSGSSDVFIAKYDANGNLLWAQRFGGSSYDGGVAITTDSNNNIYLTGYFSSQTIAFGTTILTNAGNNTSDIFIAKYDASGNALWAKRAGGSGVDRSGSIKLDNFGNIYLVGNFVSASIVFGTTTLTNAGSFTNDLFVVKYDANGNAVWARSSGGTDNEFAYGIATDGNGNAFVTGYFKSNVISFGAIALSLFSSGFSDIFIVKYDSNGNAIWAQNPGGPFNESGNGIAVDGSNNVYVTGYFQSPTIDFGSTTLTNTVSGYSDIFTVKYDNNGNVIWANGEGDGGYDVANSIDVDGTGNVYVAGYFESPTLTIGSTTLTNQGSSDIFAINYNTNGNVQWAKGTGGLAQDWSYSISSGGNGTAFITGYFQSGTIDFGSTTLTNAGIFDVYLAKISDATGIAEWSVSDNYKISPIPFSQFTILKSSVQLQSAKLRFTNVCGQIVKVMDNINGKDIKIYRGELTEGIYFVQLTQNGELLSNSKIVIAE